MKRDGTLTMESESHQLYAARQSKRIRDAEAEIDRLTNSIADLVQRNNDLAQQLARAQAAVAELSKPLCASSREAAWHESDTDRVFGRM